MLEKRCVGRSDEFGVFSSESISANNLVFSFDDWIQDEQEGWFTISPEELKDFSKEERLKYLRYCYDRDFGVIIGTLDWDRAKHLSNFINHSCEPTLIYDYNDNIIAARDLLPGEELTLDYGNFVVNTDQDFTCGCGTASCRKRIKKDDWKQLAHVYGYHFPTFLHPKLEMLFKSEKSVFTAREVMPVVSQAW
ncbi:MAG: SET domain-containing protein-lysine N-methyltransferase [Spirochaetia bacterium]|nr:SET domain-containing protein-lysine N-methyltransferase [Spirochaetia bacterium]